MRKAIAVAVIGLAASFAFAATGKLQPLNAKTGLWQMTQTVKWAVPSPQQLSGLPPQMAAIVTQMAAYENQHPTTTYKSCVKPKDLSSDPWAGGSGNRCSWTVLRSTATDEEVQGTSCHVNGKRGMTAQMHGKIHLLDSEHGTGSFDVTLTGNGVSMHSHADYTGKWIGATCPADMR